MTWSVATPMWVAPSASMLTTDRTTPRAAPISVPSSAGAGRLPEEMPEQLVGAVHEMYFHVQSLAGSCR